MKIALLDPFFSGSHKSWALEFQKHSSHQIDLFTLPGQFWKWRFNGGAPLLAEQFNTTDTIYDAILSTSLLDLPTFLALSRKKSAHIPIAHYFHENQLAYPWSTQDTETKRGADQHYILKNVHSALAADKVLFNSEYNRSSFITNLSSFYKRFPDYNEAPVETIAKKSNVLPIGLELDQIPYGNSRIHSLDNPIILWNHRWEYDKGADTFFRVLTKLSSEGFNFQLAVVGEQPVNPKSEPFYSAHQKLHKHVIHWGFLESKEAYSNLLSKATLLPVTSRQEFFGISVMEAVYAGVIPILPERLTYPDLFTIEVNSEYFYRTEHQLYNKLCEVLRGEYPLSPLSSIAQKYQWKHLIREYDQTFTALLS